MTESFGDDHDLGDLLAIIGLPGVLLVRLDAQLLHSGAPGVVGVLKNQESIAFGDANGFVLAGRDGEAK